MIGAFLASKRKGELDEEVAEEEEVDDEEEDDEVDDEDEEPDASCIILYDICKYTPI